MTPAATVWLIDAAIGADAESVFRGWLSASEEERYQSFTRTLRRRQFIAGRGLLRLALAQLLNLRPNEIMLAERPSLAPRLQGAAGAHAGFSISHSGCWVACAVSAQSPVGLDIEVRDPARDVLALAEQALGGAGVRALSEALPAERCRRFYDMWTVLEAGIKLQQRAEETYAFDHPMLSVALCSARRLDRAPRLRAARIATDCGELVLTNLTGEGTAGRPAR